MFNLFKRNVCTFEIGILHCPLKGQCRWLSCDVTEWFRNLMGLSSEDSSFFCSEISRILQMKPFFQWPSALRLAYFAVGTWFLQLVFHFLVFMWLLALHFDKATCRSDILCYGVETNMYFLNVKQMRDYDYKHDHIKCKILI